MRFVKLESWEHPALKGHSQTYETNDESRSARGSPTAASAAGTKANTDVLLTGDEVCMPSPAVHGKSHSVGHLAPRGASRGNAGEKHRGVGLGLPSPPWSRAHLLPCVTAA